MTEPPRDDELREAVRNALRELLPDVVGANLGDDHAHANGNGRPNGNGHPNGNGRPNGSAEANGGGRGPASGHRASPDGHGAAHRPASTEPDPVPLVPAPPVAAVLRPSTWAGPVVPGELIGPGQPTQERPHTRPSHARPTPASLSRPIVDARPATQPVVEARPATQPVVDARPATQPIVDARRPSPSAPLRSGRAVPAGTVVETARIDDDEDLELFVRALVTRLESPRDRLAIKAGRLRFRLQRSAAPAGAPAQDSAPAVRVPKGAVTERHVREAHADGTRLLLARAAVLTPLARETARTLGVQIERESQC